MTKKGREKISPLEASEFARGIIESMKDMGGYDRGGCFFVLMSALMMMLADMPADERERALAVLTKTINLRVWEIEL
jgi:hypothetical protein